MCDHESRDKIITIISRGSPHTSQMDSLSLGSKIHLQGLVAKVKDTVANG